MAPLIQCHSPPLAPVNPDWFYLPGFTFLVPAHPGSPGQNPESRKTVVVVVTAPQKTTWHKEMKEEEKTHSSDVKVPNMRCIFLQGTELQCTGAFQLHSRHVVTYLAER